MPIQHGETGAGHRPGERVPESGIYKVIHGEHREPHTVTAVKDELFPQCRKCKGEVSFHLLADTPHMTHDWDLSGPVAPFANPERRARKRPKIK